MRIERLLLALFVFILFACAPATPEPKTPLVIAVNPWTGFMPVVLADELGYFDEEGVDVQYLYSDNSRQQRLEFESGAYDGVTLALGTFTAIASKAPDTRVVILTDISTYGDAVVARPEIKSAADLKGKRIVTGSSGYGEIVVAAMLERAGLSPDDVIYVAMQDETQTLEMLKDGRVDAFQTWEPFVTRAVEDGANILFTGADVPGLIPDALAFHERVLTERPEDVKAFLRGWFRAVDYWLANPESATTIIHNAVGIAPDELSLDMLELLTLERNQQFFLPGSDFRSVYYTAGVYQEFFLRKGSIDQPVDINLLIAPEPVNSLP